MCVCFFSSIEFLLQFTFSFFITTSWSIFTAALETENAPFYSEENTVTLKLCGHCLLPEPLLYPSRVRLHLLPSICPPEGPEDVAGACGALGFEACFCCWFLCSQVVSQFSMQKDKWNLWSCGENYIRMSNVTGDLTAVPKQE